MTNPTPKNPAAAPAAPDKTDPAVAAGQEQEKEQPQSPAALEEVGGYLAAIAHRIDKDELATAQKLIIEGLQIAMAKLSGRNDGGKLMAAWKEKVNKAGDKIKAEVSGIVRAIIESEVKRRMDSMHSDLLSDLA